MPRRAHLGASGVVRHVMGQDPGRGGGRAPRGVRGPDLGRRTHGDVVGAPAGSTWRDRPEAVLKRVYEVYRVPSHKVGSRPTGRRGVHWSLNPRGQGREAEAMKGLTFDGGLERLFKWQPRKGHGKLSVALAVITLCVLPLTSAAVEPQEVSIRVSEDRTITGKLFVPPTPGPAPAVLVLHTRGGIEEADYSYAADLAQAGFVSLAVRYLNPKWAGQQQHPGYIKDLAMVVDWLQARPEVQGRPMGVVGFSLGSKGVSLAARRQGIKAVVSYYGVYDLRTLPRTKGRAKYPPMPVDVAAEVGAPVLLLHGARDDETPLSQAEAMRDALMKAGKVVELVVYPDAYHRFDRGPAPGMRGETSREGYTYRLDSKAKDDAWNKTLGWFRKYLISGP